MHDIHEQLVRPKTNILSQFTKTSTIQIITPDHRQMNASTWNFQNWANEKIFFKDWCIDLELYPLLC